MSLKQVAEFHRAFGHPVEEKPTIPDAKRRLLRIKLCCEELKELAKASGFPIEIFLAQEPYMVPGWMTLIENASVADDRPELVDIVEVADGLGDLDVVKDGTALEWGIPLEEVVTEIHRSNMSKLGPDGKPVYREDHKILKGPNYSPPNVARVLRWNTHQNEPMVDVDPCATLCRECKADGVCLKKRACP
jgi:predicted HAD superfamily Cof-like phosphohydrolase